MTGDDIVGLIITCALGLVMVVLAVILLRGKGANLIAGYNTMSEREKKKYDAESLSRFMGKILLPIGILTPCVALGGIYEIRWLGGAYTGGVILLVAFALIYCNTGNRFRK